MPKVYVINKGPHDYSEAEHFGELVFCSDGEVDRYDLAQMFRQLTTALEDSEQEDYLLLTSLTTLCSVASAIFAAKHGQLNVLLFKSGSYISRSLHFYDEEPQQGVKKHGRSILTGNR
jgi:hypothetical protein